MSVLLKAAVLGLGLLAFVATTANARVYHYRYFRHAYWHAYWHPYYGRLGPRYGFAYRAAPYYGYGSSLPGSVGFGAGTNGGP